MHKSFIICLLAGSLFAACNPSKEDNKPAAEKPSTNMPDATAPAGVITPNLSLVKLDAEKDPVCGMPARNHTADTAQYKGKVYGFCAKECKDEFLKDPESFLAQK